MQPLPRHLIQLWKLSNLLRLQMQLYKLLSKPIKQLYKLMLVLLNQNINPPVIFQLNKQGAILNKLHKLLVITSKPPHRLHKLSLLPVLIK